MFGQPALDGDGARREVFVARLKPAWDASFGAVDG
jgi:hypothetical protein